MNRVELCAAYRQILPDSGRDRFPGMCWAQATQNPRRPRALEPSIVISFLAEEEQLIGVACRNAFVQTDSEYLQKARDQHLGQKRWSALIRGSPFLTSFSNRPSNRPLCLG